MRVFHLMIWVALLACGALSQATADGWTTLATKDGAFSVDVPSDYIVYKNKAKDEVTVLASRLNSTFVADFRATKSGKSLLASSRKELDLESTTLRSYTVGKYNVDIYTTEKELISYVAEVASDSAYFRIKVTSRTKNEADMGRFLASCKLDGKVLMKSPGVYSVNPGKVNYVNELLSSPVVISALEHKQSSKIPVIDKWNKDAEPIDTRFYSRPLVILKKEVAGYTNSARDQWIKGEVALSILFKADGDIGEIRVVNGLGGGLTQEAVNSAMRIKFLPAEIDGKPVDVAKTFTYGFKIY